jgi:hypothetical protein
MAAGGQAEAIPNRMSEEESRCVQSTARVAITSKAPTTRSRSGSRAPTSTAINPEMDRSDEQIRERIAADAYDLAAASAP